MEDNAKLVIEIAEPIMLWLIRWAAMLPSRYLVGKDGQTPIERRRGRKCGIEVFPYGETVWYKELRESKARKNQLESEHKEGIWLGHSRSSNEAIIGTLDGIVRAYSIHRKAEGEKMGPGKDTSSQGNSTAAES